MASEFRQAVLLSFSFMLCAYLDHQASSLGNDSKEGNDKGVARDNPMRLGVEGGLVLFAWTDSEAVVIAMLLIAPIVIDLIAPGVEYFLFTSKG